MLRSDWTESGKDMPYVSIRALGMALCLLEKALLQ
jgi:hypothetical protein